MFVLASAQSLANQRVRVTDDMDLIRSRNVQVLHRVVFGQSMERGEPFGRDVATVFSDAAQQSIPRGAVGAISPAGVL
ncbi:hypothetical protein AUC69_06375 [Methyloceanibacter superfactus]|uniref:Uncharacterized protein n=1 Tax=Methyloceanibacter superfactus TaxID=1774969 RepID=A0A1E3W738_9HYPH|nr:hypothetical protein AUC69_06375 [Methyloceanibacter superfactus]